MRRHLNAERTRDLRAAMVACAALAPWSKRPISPAELLGETSDAVDDDRQLTAEESVAYLKGHLKA